MNTTMPSEIPKKMKRGGVGGKSSKSDNFIEAKQANTRRQAKLKAQQEAEDDEERKEWMEEQDRKFAPVDKHDVRNQKKLQEK